MIICDQWLWNQTGCKNVWCDSAKLWYVLRYEVYVILYNQDVCEGSAHIKMTKQGKRGSND